jgi:hypothetical protein
VGARSCRPRRAAPTTFEDPPPSAEPSSEYISTFTGDLPSPIVDTAAEAEPLDFIQGTADLANSGDVVLDRELSEDGPLVASLAMVEERLDPASRIRADNVVSKDTATASWQGDLWLQERDSRGESIGPAQGPVGGRMPERSRRGDEEEAYVNVQNVSRGLFQDMPTSSKATVPMAAVPKQAVSGSGTPQKLSPDAPAEAVRPVMGGNITGESALVEDGAAGALGGYLSLGVSDSAEDAAVGVFSEGG